MAKQKKRHSFCLWCHIKLELPDDFDEKMHRPFCSMLCMTANMLFEQYYVPIKITISKAELRWKGPKKKKGGGNASKSNGI